MSNKKDNTDKPVVILGGGMEHNPAAITKRGKIRAQRIKECKETGVPYNAHDYDTEKG